MVVIHRADEFAALLSRTQIEANTDNGLEGLHLAVFGHGSTSIGEPFQTVLTREVAQSLAEVLAVAIITEQL